MGGGILETADSGVQVVGTYSIWKCIIGGAIVFLIGIFVLISGVFSDKDRWTIIAIGCIVTLVGGAASFFCYKFKDDTGFKRMMGIDTTVGLVDNFIHPDQNR